MASLYLLSQSAPNIRVIYTIDQAVGRGCPNKRDDVALVQFFLRAVLEDGKEFKVPGPALAIDGICGAQTVDYIKSWQAQENKLSGGGQFAPVQDGQVSPALDRSGVGSRSHHRYTIIALNVQYAHIAGVDKHSNIALDPRCPVNLLPSIFWR